MMMVAAVLITLALNGVFGARDEGSIENNESLFQAPVAPVQHGPYGGTGGFYFNDVPYAAYCDTRSISKIRVRYGGLIDNLEIEFRGPGPQPAGHGWIGGTLAEISLDESEVVTSINLYATDVLVGIQFTITNSTTTRQTPHYGGTTSTPTHVNLGAGGLKYISGRAANIVDQVSFWT